MRLTGKGRRWIQGGHPWVYRDDIADGDGTAGELVPVEAPSGEVLGWGLYSTASRIAVRLVTRRPEQPRRDFWNAVVERALAARTAAGLMNPEGACRLLSGDADGVPGLVVDRYGTALVLQSGCQGSDRMRDFILELLEEQLPFEITTLVDRSDTGVRKHEELEARTEILRGSAQKPVLVQEEALLYEVNLLAGHKTGHYLDQRFNRQRAAHGAQGERVLDAFCYDGLFGIRAALAGAESVLCLDQSAEAEARLMRNAELNGVAERVSFEKVNAMTDLRRRAQAVCAGEEASYGLVVLDPPAFARSRREVRGAERGYVELNRRGMELLGEGGELVSASCSHAIRPEDFLEFIGAGARGAGCEVFLKEFTGAGPDHPARLLLPESRYLKCAFLRVAAV
ncbi:MAG TPA: class I SAM-dependent rRNA methyltransferase [Planctomycetota bacterium]|nr:class I SAM-dependent rRNA methyltransferase [Planctomycetota bacterium]